MASDGKINYQQFYETLSRVYSGCSKEKFSQVFRDADSDLDGLLNAAEMSDAMAKLAEPSAQTLAERGISDEEMKQPIKVHSLHVNSTIQSRFATTVVDSLVANRLDSAKETEFCVNLPDAAFITKFSMVIDGKTIHGDVKEKAEAKQNYDAAKSSGRSAGHIAKRPRETNCFQISVNVAALSEVSFKLTYQEVLERVHGYYKHVVNVQPGQVVEDLEVRVRVEEARRISAVHVPAFGARVGERVNRDLLGLPRDTDVRVDERLSDAFSAVDVLYRPSPERQRQLAVDTQAGVAGQLVLLYDVHRPPNDGGQLQVVDGYFVHFFAPSGLPPTKKHIVFVVDVSGSMGGRKIQQTKEALRLIISDLNQEDCFNIVTFSDAVHFWQPSSKTVSPQNCADAITFVDKLKADGCTDIDKAFKQTLQLFDEAKVSPALHPTIIFLTDGQPTSGECNSAKICSKIESYNRKRFAAIHSLAFGSDADFALLMRISDGHRGLAKKLYEDSDASLQLQGFYAQVSSPLLTDVNFRYLNELVDPDSIVQEKHGIYYSGAESMVLGRLKATLSPTDRLCAEIAGMGLNGCQKFIANCEIAKSEGGVPSTETVGGFVERMWAYKTVKKLLDRSKYIETDAAVASRTKKDALGLCLKYEFVTELTSMVVVQPEVLADQECQVARGDDPWSSLRDTMLGAPLKMARRTPPSALAGYAYGATPQSATFRAGPYSQASSRAVMLASRLVESESEPESDEDMAYGACFFDEDLGGASGRGLSTRRVRLDSDEADSDDDGAMGFGVDEDFRAPPPPPPPPPPPKTLSQLLRDRPLCQPKSGLRDEPDALVDAANPLLQHALRSSNTSVWAPVAASAARPIDQVPASPATEVYDEAPWHSVQLGSLRLNVLLAGDYAVRGVGAALCRQLDAWHAADPRLPGAQGYRTLLPLSDRRRLFDLHELIVGSLTGAEHVVLLGSQTDFAALSLARSLGDFDLFKQTFVYHLQQLFTNIKGTGSKAILVFLGPFEQCSLSAADADEWGNLTAEVCDKNAVAYVSLKSFASVNAAEFAPLDAAVQFQVGKHLAHTILSLLESRA